MQITINELINVKFETINNFWKRAPADCEFENSNLIAEDLNK